MSNKCSIAGCPSLNHGEAYKIPLFPFPESAKQRTLWLSKIGTAGGRVTTTTQSDSVLCSLHFSVRSFTLDEKGSTLKDDAVPTKHLCPLARPSPLITELEGSPSDSEPCLVCNLPIKHMYELLKEVHIHRENRFLVCGHCREGFDSYSKYMAHVTELGVTKPFTQSLNPRPPKVVRLKFQCALCYELFETTIARNVHMATTHNLKETLEHARKDQQDREKIKRPGRRVKILAAGFEEAAASERPPPSRTTRTRRRKILADTNTFGKSLRRKRQRKILKNNVNTRFTRLRKATKQAMETIEEVIKQGRLFEDDDSESKMEIVTENAEENVTKVHYYGARTLRCGFCWREFATLKNLDKHCSLKHPDQDAPLELMCEVDDGGQDARKEKKLCKLCLRKKLCLEMLQDLLDDTDRVLKSSSIECSSSD